MNTTRKMLVMIDNDKLHFEIYYLLLLILII